MNFISYHSCLEPLQELPTLKIKPKLPIYYKDLFELASAFLHSLMAGQLPPFFNLNYSYIDLSIAGTGQVLSHF